MKKNKPGLQKPFFAKFLEGQIPESGQDEVQGGDTKKYPSDQEDDDYTKKFPSDQEDDGYTKKYPSDQEDDFVTKPAADILHTQKYPSDSDEV